MSGPASTGNRPAGRTSDGSTTGDIPALERAIAVLHAAEASPEGVTAFDLAPLGIPRTSLYRILDTLVRVRMLAATDGAVTRFTLGTAIVRMASRVTVDDSLAARAGPVLMKLTAETGETAKIVMREDLETVTIAFRHPRQESRVTAHLGARLPLHVGASQRLLLSRAPQHIVDLVLARPLHKRGLETIVDPRLLERNIEQLRKRDWALGRNEGVAGVGSIGALIHESGQPVRCALALLYILEGKSRKAVLRMRDRVMEAAADLSAP